MKLDLDFSIQSMSERSKFVNSYVSEKNDLTSDQLETIGSYILWGKDADGRNAKQQKSVQLKSRYSTWGDTEIASLDQLQENPNFSENLLRPINETPPLIRKEKFSRAEARKYATPEQLRALESLWREIDSLELSINFWELDHGKRKNPPRQPLLDRFSQEEIESIHQRASTLTQYQYLRRRHLLVERRTEQFSYRDSWVRHIQRHLPISSEPITPTFGENILVRPAGLLNDSLFSQSVFPKESRFPHPSLFNDKHQRQLARELWPTTSQKTVFDFSEEEHLLGFLRIFEEISWELDDLPMESTLRDLYRTFDWYASRANLSDTQKLVLDMKIRHKTNDEIRDFIFQTTGKKYGVNYISTIFHKRIIPAIASTARLHREILENCAFPENFKQCKDCGETLLMTPDLFMRKQQSKDGFSGYCKICEKKRRDARKA